MFLGDWIQLPAQEPEPGEILPMPESVYAFGRVFCVGAVPPVEVKYPTDRMRRVLGIRRGDREGEIMLNQLSGQVTLDMYSFAFIEGSVNGESDAPVAFVQEIADRRASAPK